MQKPVNTVRSYCKSLDQITSYQDVSYNHERNVPPYRVESIFFKEEYGAASCHYIPCLFAELIEGIHPRCLKRESGREETILFVILAM